MSENEQKNPLENTPFAFRRYKNGNVSISWKNKEVMILKGDNAEKFLADIAGADEYENQLAMAKITGNFKRGNEREGKKKGK